MKKKTSSPKTAESGKLKKALSCWQLYILLIPALIWLIVFAYRYIFIYLITNLLYRDHIWLVMCDPCNIRLIIRIHLLA